MAAFLVMRPGRIEQTSIYNLSYSGFKGEDVDRLTDDGRTLYAGVIGILLVHLGAIGSGEQITKMIHKNTALVKKNHWMV